MARKRTQRGADIVRSNPPTPTTSIAAAAAAPVSPPAAYSGLTRQPEPVPALDASADTWAEYVQRSQKQLASAYIEWGKKLRRAHEAYNHQEQRWASTFEAWCTQILGVSKAAVLKAELVATQFERLAPANLARLPGSQDALYQLAQFHRDHPERFEGMLEELGPTASRNDVLKVLKPDQAKVHRRVGGDETSIRGLIPKSLKPLLDREAASRGLSVEQLVGTILIEHYQQMGVD